MWTRGRNDDYRAVFPPFTSMSDSITMSSEDWSAVQAAAAELDLIHGGYYRVRTNAIAFYCSPENHPEGWSEPYNDGTPEAPRQCVGEAEATDEGAAAVRVRFVVTNWAGLLTIKLAYDRGAYRDRFTEYVRDQENAIRGRREDRAWIRAQFDRLRTHVSGALVEG